MNATIPVGQPGFPACVWCGKPVENQRWNYKPVIVGQVDNKNNIHQRCRVLRAKGRKP